MTGFYMKCNNGLKSANVLVKKKNTGAMSVDVVAFTVNFE